nr:MAG TPA: hypothetical protein [Caudoviricetes sp.]
MQFLNSFCENSHSASRSVPCRIIGAAHKVIQRYVKVVREGKEPR